MSSDSNFMAAQAAFSRKIKTYSYHAVSHLPGYDIEDIEQELLSILWKCVISYDPNKGATFNTYAQRSFQNRIASLVREVTARKRGGGIVTCSLDVEAVAVAADEANLDFDTADLAILRMVSREAVEETRNASRRERRQQFRDRILAAG